jgi:hypothetical protein
VSLPRRAMDEMGLAVCCLMCNAPDEPGTTRCKGCIERHSAARRALFTERASSPIQQLARTLASMIQNPGDHLADPVNGPYMALYHEALLKHQGTSQAETMEDVERLFKEARSKRKPSHIRDIANQNPWVDRNPDRAEIDKALEALSISERAPEWWDELNDEIEAIDENRQE